MERIVDFDRFFADHMEQNQSIDRSINQRLYLTSNLLITKLLISPKKVNL